MTEYKPPRRITDLVNLKRAGVEITCTPTFEILPVDFTHRQHQFQAYIFLCRYDGHAGENTYSFRKCYARGCPHNLCTHVSQAVMIANRYLQRDFRELNKHGIEVEIRLFSLDKMVVQFENLHDRFDPMMTLQDYIHMAEEGNEVSITIDLEYVPAVEHFVNYDNAQTFLMADFGITTLNRKTLYQRCFACYPTDQENGEKKKAEEVANARLDVLYGQFDEVAIKYDKRYFN